jgi:SAM-dependent methyltransferase
MELDVEPEVEVEPDPYDLDAATREHYVDPALYDFEYRRRRADVNHYRRLAGELQANLVLELGCGTGRILAPLARDGHLIVGIDMSPTMLKQAAARRDRLSAAARARVMLLRADMRAFSLGEKFPLIICGFNSFQHLYTRTDVELTLERFRKHLSPSGRLAIDVMNPDLRWLTRDSRKRWARTKFTHPSTGIRYEYSTNHTYDPVTQIAYVRIYYQRLDGDELGVVRLAHRQFFPAELEALISAGGFRIEERWGGFDRQPFEGDSDSQVLLCKLR